MNRESKKEISKERILKAALEEFGQNDFNTASTNTICKNHQISKGLLFHYYKNKDELFLLCVEKCFTDLSNYLKNNYIKRENSVEKNLNNYFTIRFNFFNEFPYYAQIFKTATFNAPIHLINDIRKLKTTLRDTNEMILIDMFESLDIKDEFEKRNVVYTILDFADYLQIKQQVKVEDEEVNKKDFNILFDEQNKELINMINMLFYGVVK